MHELVDGSGFILENRHTVSGDWFLAENGGRVGRSLRECPKDPDHNGGV